MSWLCGRWRVDEVGGGVRSEKLVWILSQSVPEVKGDEEKILGRSIVFKSKFYLSRRT